MKITLVGATHPSRNPRLVREADALAEAGYDTRVVAPVFEDEAWDADRRLMSSRGWRFEPVDFRWTTSPARSLFVRGKRKLAAGLVKVWPTRSVMYASYLRAFSELSAAAAAERADWFIAHTQPTLPIASRACARFSARLGFDCEDLLDQNGCDPPEVVHAIEEQYLAKCDYVSVPSQSIGRYLADRYAIENPEVLYNVFPLKLAEGLAEPKFRQDSEVLRLHWFGQTIGFGRGIEEVVAALPMVGAPCELHLRGRVVPEFRTELERVARQHGVEERVRILPLVHPDDLIPTMGGYDVGLATERPSNGNYSKTVTNKFFTYMLAGLAIAATQTAGQAEVMSQVPECGFLYGEDNPESLADGLTTWACNREALGRAQQASWAYAREVFCWDRMKARFLSQIGQH